jgi:hypothetical protein
VENATGPLTCNAMEAAHGYVKSPFRCAWRRVVPGLYAFVIRRPAHYAGLSAFLPINSSA